MKVILYMAITPNGLIAKENDNTTSWVSKLEWESFKQMSRKIGNIIIGRRTYDVAVREGDFPFQDCFNIVVTKKEIDNKWGNNVAFASSPKEAIRILSRKGFNKVLVGGGGGVNASFMNENLVDEIYFDIEPVIFGKGIKLFSDENFETKLSLIGTKKLSKNEIQLHYKVVK